MLSSNAMRALRDTINQRVVLKPLNTPSVPGTYMFLQHHVVTSRHLHCVVQATAACVHCARVDCITHWPCVVQCTRGLISNMFTACIVDPQFAAISCCGADDVAMNKLEQLLQTFVPTGQRSMPHDCKYGNALRVNGSYLALGTLGHCRIVLKVCSTASCQLL